MPTINETILATIRQFNEDYDGDDRDLTPWLADRICFALRREHGIYGNLMGPL